MVSTMISPNKTSEALSAGSSTRLEIADALIGMGQALPFRDLSSGLEPVAPIRLNGMASIIGHRRLF